MHSSNMPIIGRERNHWKRPILPIWKRNCTFIKGSSIPWKEIWMNVKLNGFKSEKNWGTIAMRRDADDANKRNYNIGAAAIFCPELRGLHATNIQQTIQYTTRNSNIDVTYRLKYWTKLWLLSPHYKFLILLLIKWLRLGYVVKQFQCLTVSRWKYCLWCH